MKNLDSYNYHTNQGRSQYKEAQNREIMKYIIWSAIVLTAVTILYCDLQPITSKTMKLPHYIIKKNKMSNYYYDTVHDKWIHKNNINDYVDGLGISYRDKETRNSGFNLNC